MTSLEKPRLLKNKTILEVIKEIWAIFKNAVASKIFCFSPLFHYWIWFIRLAYLMKMFIFSLIILLFSLAEGQCSSGLHGNESQKTRRLYSSKENETLNKTSTPLFSRLSSKSQDDISYSPYIEVFPEHIPTIRVDDFLQRCATQLGIRVDNPSKSVFFLPLGCDEEHIVTVKLPSLTHSESVETFRVYDPNEKLMRGQIFSPSDKAEGGTRQVGFYSINGKRALCAKKNPEAPGQERAVEILNKLLFEENDLSLVPKSMTISMNNEIFLISEYIEGETLEDAMNENSQNSHYMKDCKFNTKYFQQAILLSFLINPEDGRAQSLISRIKII